MRTRRIIFTGSATAAGALAVVVGLTARGQDYQQPAAVKYYQGKVSPPPSWLSQASTNRAAAQAGQAGPGGALPPPVLPYAGANPGVVPADGRVRFTQPVVAGGDGVRPASATDSGLPPPTLPGPQSPVSVNPPAYGLPPTPADGDPGAGSPRLFPLPTRPQPLPDPKPLGGMGGADNRDLLPPPPGMYGGGGDPRPYGRPDGIPGGAAPRLTTTVEKSPVPDRQPLQEQRPAPAAAAAPLPIPAGTPLPTKAAPSLTVDAVAPETVGVGQPLTYELVVRNVGNSPVVGVRVEDELPARAAFVSSEPAAETTGDRLAWSLGAMEQGVEKRIRVTVKPADEGDVRSRAVVTFAAGVEARVKVTRPKIVMTMSGPGETRVGEKVAFTVKITNTGTGPAAQVVLEARLGAGLTHPQGQVIEAKLKNLPAGETKILTLEAIAGKSGTHACGLTAAADGGPAESATAQVSLVEPMLAVKQTGPARCLVKAEPVFQIELSNPGTAPTDPVQLWAALPVGFDFVQATDGGQFQDPARTIGWRLPGLPAGSTKTVAIKLRATGPTEGTIRTVAQTAGEQPAPAAGVIPADARSGGGRPLEARVDTPVKAEGVPALRFEVQDDEDPVEVGKEAVYVIRVMNQGTGPCSNVQIVADLGDGMTVSGQPTGPTAGRTGGQQLVFDPIPQFGVKAEAVYRVRVKGTVAGDQRFRVRLACDQIRTPIVKEENTRFYKE